MSVLITTLLVGCGVLVGRMIAKGGDRDREHAQVEAEAKAESQSKEEVAVSKDEPSARFDGARLERLPCRLRDVVLRGSGDEAWLAGAVLLSEGREVVAALFVSPDAGGDRFVLARAASDELLWLAPQAGVSSIAGEPPTVLEVAKERFDRKRRLPLAAERVGSGAPDVGPQVIFAEYTGLGEDRLVVLAGSGGATWAYRGPVLLAGMYDVLPGK